MFLDTNVLFGGLKRDLTLTFALACGVEVRWSNHVLGELTRHLSEYYAQRGIGDPSARVASLLRRMNGAFARALDTVSAVGDIGSGWPDEDDERVVKDALSAGASLIVTDNLRDFPRGLLAPLELEALSADAFLERLTREGRLDVEEALDDWLVQRTRPSYTRKQLLARLGQVGLTRFRATLSEVL